MAEYEMVMAATGLIRSPSNCRPSNLRCHQRPYSYTEAFQLQNHSARKAIQSLDTLNDQIVQYVLSSRSCNSPPTSPPATEGLLTQREKETLQSSLGLMRKLLVEAQMKFYRMVEENKRLGQKIDGSIQTANSELSTLRDELQDTHRKLNEINRCGGDDSEEKTTAESDGVSSPPTPSNLRTKTTASINGELEHITDELKRLRDRNLQLEEENKILQCKIEQLKRLNSCLDADGVNSQDFASQIQQLEHELHRSKDALSAMKSDRKKLKSDKCELLMQMKQLYTTLETKENELREFIRNYEVKMRESDDAMKQLVGERQEAEREKWELIKKARDSAERTISLRTQLDLKEAKLQELEMELEKAKQKLEGSHPMSPSNSNCSCHTSSNLDNLTPRSFGSQEISYSEAPSMSLKNCKSLSASISSGKVGDRVSVASTGHVDILHHCMHPMLETVRSHSAEDLSHDKKKKKKPRRFNSISRMFGRHKTRKSMELENNSEERYEEFNGPYTEELYMEKLKILEEAQGIPMDKWKACEVVAWLEITLKMQQYARHCFDNVKSGKMLMGLTDSEMETGLGIRNSLHKRKLRLALEEIRDPSRVAFANAGDMDHVYVSKNWIHDVGLPQYTHVFEEGLVDGRMLNTFSKKDLEKHLGITRRSHQNNILDGIELLRIVKFDKNTLTKRRSQCEQLQTDPLVWTNQRVMKWISTIDLKEYAVNLSGSGIHGASLVLQSITGDQLANMLEIPQNRYIVRRHLSAELLILTRPAKEALEAIPGITAKCKHNKKQPSTLGHAFIRSQSNATDHKDKIHFRGSLGKAFNRRSRSQMEHENHEEGKLDRRRAFSHDFERGALV